jgi:hypothetical protein
MLKALKENPISTGAGIAGLSVITAELDKVQTPKDWALFGIKTALFFFMVFCKDPKRAKK